MCVCARVCVCACVCVCEEGFPDELTLKYHVCHRYSQERVLKKTVKTPPTYYGCDVVYCPTVGNKH